jgi:predicted outer membrane protein
MIVNKKVRSAVRNKQVSAEKTIDLNCRLALLNTEQKPEQREIQKSGWPFDEKPIDEELAQYVMMR